MKQGGKYLLILILFLLPGIGLFSKDTVAERLLDGGQAATVNITHQSITSSQDIYSAMMDTFSSICRVETIKIEGRDYCRSFGWLLSFLKTFGFLSNRFFTRKVINVYWPNAMFREPIFIFIN